MIAFKKKFAALGLALAIILTAAALAAVQHQRGETPTIDRTAPHKIDDTDTRRLALSALADPAKPVTIAIIGDNTSKLDGGWINIVANWISVEYKRTVALHTLDDLGSSYRLNRLFNEQYGSTVEIFSGEVRNANIQQVGNKLDVLSPPIAPDLLLVSQGHNAGSRSLAKTSITILRDLRQRFPDAEIAAILQNPWDSKAEGSRQNDLNVRDLRVSAVNSGFTTVDIYQSFLNHADWTSLLESDGTYPNGNGYIHWASEMEDYIASQVTSDRPIS